MRKFATVSILILVAYTAGSGHFTKAIGWFYENRADKVVAFNGPAVPYITAAGDAVWSVVRLGGDVFAGNPQPRAFMTDAPPFVVAAVKMAAKNLYVRAIVYKYSWQNITIAVFAWIWLIVGMVWAIIASTTPWGTHPFPSMVGYIWGKRPEVDGQRTLPLWLAALILPAAVFEFGARNCYFVGFTVVTLILVPLKVLKGLLTFDLSRLVPSGKPATSTFKDAILRARVSGHSMSDGKALFIVVVIVVIMVALGLLITAAAPSDEFAFACGNHSPAHTVLARSEPTMQRMQELTERHGCSLWRVAESGDGHQYLLLDREAEDRYDHNLNR